jgi:spore germination cell wall hydrolase CwlJ-like protein
MSLATMFFKLVLLFPTAAAAPALPDAQLFCLTSTVYGESRGESELGQALVAQTVMNRAADPRWPSTPCGVVAQASQFAGFKAAVPRNAQDRESWELAKALSRVVAAGQFRVGSCSRTTHFHEASIRPTWAKSMRRLCRVDSHIFYEDKQ